MLSFLLLGSTPTTLFIVLFFCVLNSFIAQQQLYFLSRSATRDLIFFYLISIFQTQSPCLFLAQYSAFYAKTTIFVVSLYRTTLVAKSKYYSKSKSNIFAKIKAAPTLFNEFSYGTHFLSMRLLCLEDSPTTKTLFMNNVFLHTLKFTFYFWLPIKHVRSLLELNNQ